MKKLVDHFLFYLAVERGLSTNYQTSTRHSLETFAKWLTRWPRITKISRVEPEHFTNYLAWRKRSGLTAASLRLEAIALRIFFRFLHARKILQRNPAENLCAPRPERYLPETLNVQSITRCLKASASAKEAPADPTADFAISPYWNYFTPAGSGCQSSAMHG